MYAFGKFGLFVVTMSPQQAKERASVTGAESKHESF